MNMTVILEKIIKDKSAYIALYMGYLQDLDAILSLQYYSNMR